MRQKGVFLSGEDEGLACCVTCLSVKREFSCRGKIKVLLAALLVYAAGGRWGGLPVKGSTTTAAAAGAASGKAFSEEESSSEDEEDAEDAAAAMKRRQEIVNRQIKEHLTAILLEVTDQLFGE
jgi:hypothetical protein